MLTIKAASELIRQLKYTRGFPEDSREALHFAEVLAEAAPDPEWAAKVVDRLRRTSEFFPADAKFYSLAQEFGRPGSSSEYVDFTSKQPECPAGKCDGYGWIPTERHGISCVIPCECRAKPPEPTTKKRRGSLERAGAS